jgi:hypothetical protein
MTALPADQRPWDDTPIHTTELPDTPRRDANIPAEAWVEAPAVVLRAGEDIGGGRAAYKRRIGRWLLWRAGPARGGDARYVAVDADDLEVHHIFRQYPDSTGTGTGPSGRQFEKFGPWKRDLRDHG